MPPRGRRDRQVVRILGILYVREREWHPTQRFRTLAHGRLELTFRAGRDFEIASWILGWGDAAEVVHPACLRRDVAANVVDHRKVRIMSGPT